MEAFIIGIIIAYLWDSQKRKRRQDNEYALHTHDGEFYHSHAHGDVNHDHPNGDSSEIRLTHES